MPHLAFQKIKKIFSLAVQKKQTIKKYVDIKYKCMTARLKNKEWFLFIIVVCFSLYIIYPQIN